MNRIVLIATLVLFCYSHAFSQRLTQDSALKGLKDFTVEVEELSSQAEKDGLHRSTIQTDVELRLRKAGIQVNRRDPDTPRYTQFYVKIGARRGELPVYGFSISIEVIDAVTLQRNPNSKLPFTLATIWGISTVGTVGADNIKQIRESLGDYVDIFINEYLAQNPK